MACPNFKKGLKMAFGPLGVKQKPDGERLVHYSLRLVLCYI
jgi:hypothetical protein